VATGHLNVATGSFSRICILVESSNKMHFLQHISLNGGDNKESVATKVANVATGACWLDNAALNGQVK
jgi:hypothetical protein